MWLSALKTCPLSQSKQESNNSIEISNLSLFILMLTSSSKFGNSAQSLKFVDAFKKFNVFLASLSNNPQKIEYWLYLEFFGVIFGATYCTFLPRECSFHTQRTVVAANWGSLSHKLGITWGATFCTSWIRHHLNINRKISQGDIWIRRIYWNQVASRSSGAHWAKSVKK